MLGRMCVRECRRRSKRESRELDKDLEKEGVRVWEPGKEERNVHLREKQCLGSKCASRAIRSDSEREWGKEGSECHCDRQRWVE